MFKNLTSPYIIAEVSANHKGSLARAKQIISSAAQQGADCIKLQSYTPQTMTIKSDKPDFQINSGPWKGQALWDLYQQAHTPYEWHKPLFDHARECGICCISTPFDESAVDLLEGLNAPFYKIASFEITDLPLVEYVAKTGKPMIISTGMASLEEIADALAVVKRHGCGDFVLLYCVSAYPAPTEQMNLAGISLLRETFACEVGLSDHSLGNVAAVAAVALGAKVIEKHVTLRRADGGVDAEFSLEPEELGKFVQDVQSAAAAIGSAQVRVKKSEESSVKFRRSIYVVEDMKKGDKFTQSNIRRIRPGSGLAPKFYRETLGKEATCDLERGDALKRKHIK